jgi:maltose alpha-D-glucosyltransferase/alpha-amylase
MGEGISARLSELMDRDERRILLAYSIILTLPGTPVIYYGDEVGKLNDIEYYNETITLTGKDDTRFLVRGKMNWAEIDSALSQPDSLSSKVYYPLRQMLTVRNQSTFFGRATLEFIKTSDSQNDELLVFKRTWENSSWLIIHNMTDKEIRISQLNTEYPGIEILHKSYASILEPYGYRWIQLI